VEIQDWSHRIAFLKRLGAETSYQMWIFAGITWSFEFQEWDKQRQNDITLNSFSSSSAFFPSIHYWSFTPKKYPALLEGHPSTNESPRLA
jgi:hypothetical protein